MKASVEQLCPRGRWYSQPGSHRRWHKREAHRLMRRLGRALLDDAPRRYPLRGYSD